MKDRAYALGFIYKCAEYGVSPYEAGSLFMQKQAGSYTFAPEPQNRTPGIGITDEDMLAEGYDPNDVVSGFVRDTANDINRNAVRSYADVYNTYYNNLMGKTKDGYDDDSMARLFARRMEEIDAGKPGTAWGRAWRSWFWSPEEQRRYNSDLAHERAQRVLAEIRDERARMAGVEKSVASLRPGYVHPKPAATAAAPAQVATTLPAAPPAPAAPAANPVGQYTPPPGFTLKRTSFTS